MAARTRARDIAVRYVVDLQDRGTRELLREDRQIRRQVQQTGRAMERSHREAGQAAGRHANAEERVGRAARDTSRSVARANSAHDRSVRAHSTATTAADRHAAALNRADRQARRLNVASRVGAGGIAVLGRGAGLAATAIGVVGLGGALRFMAEEVGEAQKVTAQTDAALRSTGGAANVTAKKIERLASSTARKTGIDDEMIQQGSNILLTFTKIRNEGGRLNNIFDRANTAALDLSVRFGKDLNTSAIMVGKALNDPVKGTTALGRAGVQFTKQQKDQIKTLVDSGQHLKAQRLILRELETQVGGSARAYGRTLPGAVGRAKVAIGDLAERHGNKLAPSIDKAVTRGTRFIRQMEQGKGAGGRFADTLEDVAEGAGDVLGPMGKAAKAAAQFAARHPQLLKVAGGIAAAGLAIRGLRFARAVSGVDQVLSGLRRLANTRAGQAMRDKIAGAAGQLWGRMRRGVRAAGANTASAMGRYGTQAGGLAGGNIVTTTGGRVEKSAKKGGRLNKAMGRAGKFLGPAIVAGLVIGLAEAWPDIEKKIAELVAGTKGLDRLKREKQKGKSNPWLHGHSLSDDPLVGWLFRRGGGTVDTAAVALSPGELGVTPTGQSFVVPGHRRAADNVLASVPQGTMIFTDHGQQMLAGGASAAEALRNQLPHFQKGGRVRAGRYNSTSYGPPWGGINGTGVTRTGINLRGNPRRHLIAVDPRMIPLGSKVYVQPNPFNYSGPFLAGDTGGAIKGNRIDFYDWRGRKAQLGWGRRSVRVYQSGAKARKVELPSRLSFAGAMPSRTAAFSSGFQAGLEDTRLWDADAAAAIVGGASARLERRFATIPAAGRRAGGRGGRGLQPGGGWAGTQNLVMGAIAGLPGSKTFKRSRAINGNQNSDHNTWVKNAFATDISPGSDSIFATIRSRLGIAARKGSWNIFQNRPRAGFRSQLLWHAPDGSHKDHVHLGIRKMRVGGVVGRAIDRLGGPRAGWNPRGALRNFAGLIDELDQTTRDMLGHRAVEIEQTIRQLRRGGLTRRERRRGAALTRELRGIRGQLAPDAAPSYARLERIERDLGARIRRLQRGGATQRERVQIRRLEAAQRLVQTEMGRRLGNVARTVERQGELLEHARGRLERTMRSRGIDQASSEGIRLTLEFQQTQERVLRRSQRAIRRALDRAIKRGDRAAVRDLAGRLEAINEQLADAAADMAELHRQRILQAAQDIVDRQTHETSRAEHLFRMFALRQQLSGTQTTGGAARADFIRSQLLPALQAEMAALQGQLAAANQVGNAELARQIASEIWGKEEAMLQAQLDAQEATAENTSELKEFRGSLAFESGGFRGTDFELLGSGTGA